MVLTPTAVVFPKLTFQWFVEQIFHVRCRGLVEIQNKTWAKPTRTRQPQHSDKNRHKLTKNMISQLINICWQTFYFTKNLYWIFNVAWASFDFWGSSQGIIFLVWWGKEGLHYQGGHVPSFYSFVFKQWTNRGCFRLFGWW